MPHREIVASHLVEGAARARPEETAGDVLARLAAQKPTNVELVLVTDKHNRLQGVVPIEKLIAAPVQAKLSDIVSHGFPSVGSDTDQERAASIALHHGVDALPVVDAEGHALGVMPSHALLQILRHLRSSAPSSVSSSYVLTTAARRARTSFGSTRATTKRASAFTARCKPSRRPR